MLTTVQGSHSIMSVFMCVITSLQGLNLVEVQQRNIYFYYETFIHLRFN